jgi:ribosomal protein S18 acetylase RimI-like enzyme
MTGLKYFKESYMEIVTAQEKHIPGLTDLWEELARHHASFDPRFPMVANARALCDEYIRKFMADSDTRVLVAIDNNKPVAYAIVQIRKSPVWLREKSGYIEDMVVTSGLRHNGVGSLLLEKAMDWFKAEKIDLVELTVAVKNKVGYSFWKKHGFKDYLHRLYLKT